MRISQNVPGHGGHAGGPNIVAGHTGGPNSASGHAMPHMYNHPAAGPPFPNFAPMRQPPRTLATSDVTNLSAAELYRRQHDVIATGDNVPAPFMTFEATCFPPEILREVRYLLQKRSICRTLPCYMHTNPCVQSRLGRGIQEPAPPLFSQNINGAKPSLTGCSN